MHFIVPSAIRSILKLGLKSATRDPLSANDRGLTLPVELICIVASHLPSRNDVNNLALTAKGIYKHLVPILDNRIVIESAQRWQEFLTAVAKFPCLAAATRILELKPSTYLTHSHEVSQMEATVLRSFVEIIGLFESLHTFVWDGFEKPCDDSVWTKLRASCPNLVNIATTVGGEHLVEDSELFGFTNLRGFSLIAKPYPGYQECVERLLPGSDQSGDPLPPRFWEMLKNSPDLIRLVIKSEHVNSRLYNVLPIFALRFSSLKRLELVRVSSHKGKAYTGPSQSGSLCWFLNNNSTITDLKLCRAYFDTHFHSPNLVLDRYEGPVETLLTYGNLDQLRELVMTSDDSHNLIREGICLVLPRMTALKALTIRIDSFGDPEPYSGHAATVSDILRCTPGLESIEMHCTSTFSVPPHFSDTIKGLAQSTSLRKVAFVKTHKRGDPSLSRACRAMVLANPKLREIKLGTVSGWARDMAWDPYQTSKGLSMGEYVVQADEAGNPISISGRETLQSLRGVRKSKYECTLVSKSQPRATSATKEGRWSGVLGRMTNCRT